jgi:hypothetical protein
MKPELSALTTRCGTEHGAALAGAARKPIKEIAKNAASIKNRLSIRNASQ